ncbi:MAG: hypothetical protein WC058_06920 [Phycisphaeraceae bacterium]
MTHQLSHYSSNPSSRWGERCRAGTGDSSAGFGCWPKCGRTGGGVVHPTASARRWACASSSAWSKGWVGIVILWQHRGDKTARKILVTNRTQWECSRILRVYRRRWQGTECFHRDGKQHPRKWGDCQMRKGRGQTSGGRHMHLVFLAYSVLMRPLRCGHARA